jgi:hypothetical protein
MPKTANLASGTKSANVLAGDVNEFVPYDAEVKIRAVSSAIGIKLSLFADTDLLSDDKEIPYIGTSLIDKDHIVDEFFVEAGTRLSAFLRETASVSTTDIYFSVEITPA